MTIQEQLAPGKYKLTVDDYVRLAEAGTFAGRRAELIDGEVIIMSPQFRPHGMVKLGLYDELLIATRALGSPLRPVVEFSLDLAINSMPDPDIMLTTEPRGARAVPLASVALVIEVSDTTLNDDLSAKQRLYASAGIAEYWVADVNARVIHQMWSPVGDAYARYDKVAFGAVIASATITGLSIETTNL